MNTCVIYLIGDLNDQVFIVDSFLESPRHAKFMSHWKRSKIYALDREFVHVGAPPAASSATLEILAPTAAHHRPLKLSSRCLTKTPWHQLRIEPYAQQTEPYRDNASIYLSDAHSQRNQPRTQNMTSSQDHQSHHHFALRWHPYCIADHSPHLQEEHTKQ